MPHTKRQRRDGRGRSAPIAYRDSEKWETADAEEAAMINWAWRALYVEVTRAYIDDKPLDISAAYARFVRLAHLRVQRI